MIIYGIGLGVGIDYLSYSISVKSFLLHTVRESFSSLFDSTSYSYSDKAILFLTSGLNCSDWSGIIDFEDGLRVDSSRSFKSSSDSEYSSSISISSYSVFSSSDSYFSDSSGTSSLKISSEFALLAFLKGETSPSVCLFFLNFPRSNPFNGKSILLSVFLS